MKVAVMSDSHDNFAGLRAALSKIKEKGCNTIIFLGDFCAPSSFRLIAGAKLPLYFIFGNVDGEQMQIAREAAKMNNVTFERDFLEFTLAGKKIAICHKDDFAYALAFTGKYDVVFHGHTHEQRNEMVGKTLLANPGAVGGDNPHSFAIYDTDTNKVEFVEV